jgi:hypothetical protein
VPETKAPETEARWKRHFPKRKEADPLVQKSHNARLEARSFETRQQRQVLGKADTFASVANMPHLGNRRSPRTNRSATAFPTKAVAMAGPQITAEFVPIVLRVWSEV